MSGLVEGEGEEGGKRGREKTYRYRREEERRDGK
jgi:hypothetical protein